MLQSQLSAVKLSVELEVKWEESKDMASFEIRGLVTGAATAKAIKLLFRAAVKYDFIGLFCGVLYGMPKHVFIVLFFYAVPFLVFKSNLP